VLFLRGQFTMEDVQATALILKVYAGVLLFNSCSRIWMTSFYARKNTWYPAVCVAVGLLVHIGLAPVLMARWELLGLVGASLIASAVNATLLFVGTGVHGWGCRLKNLWQSLLKFLLSGTGLILVVQLYRELPLLESKSLRAVLLFVLITGAAACYLGLAALLRCEEVFRIRQLFQRESGARPLRKE
ncbi:MAG: lipid II flippase MurJ, partial [Bdellovibrio sp.]